MMPTCHTSCQGDLELSIQEAKEAALPTLPARDWLGQVRRLENEEHAPLRKAASTCSCMHSDSPCSI